MPSIVGWWTGRAFSAAVRRQRWAWIALVVDPYAWWRGSSISRKQRVHTILIDGKWIESFASVYKLLALSKKCFASVRTGKIFAVHRSQTCFAVKPVWNVRVDWSSSPLKGASQNDTQPRQYQWFSLTSGFVHKMTQGKSWASVNEMISSVDKTSQGNI